MRYFRARPQKSGVIYYYFDKPGKPRREIPLGRDYLKAVKRWAELMDEPKAGVVTFLQLADVYEREVMPSKAKSTQVTDRADMKHLREYFSQPTAVALDRIKPMNIRQLLKWKRHQPTTANRLKRLFSAMFNWARGEGYTDAENPCKGIEGYTLAKRQVDITDDIFQMVWKVAAAPLQDAMDLAEVCGQRPGDTLKLSERDIKNGLLSVAQGKGGRRRRIRIEGKLKLVLERIDKRKADYKVWSANLTVNTRGLALTKATMRDMWEEAREAAAVANPTRADEIRAFWFYDLRAKAADDTAEDTDDEQAAADLLGHDSVKTTKKHYLRRGKIVSPSKGSAV